MSRRKPISVLSKDTADYFNQRAGRQVYQALDDPAHPFSLESLTHLCKFMGFDKKQTDEFLAKCHAPTPPTEGAGQ